MAEMKLTGNCLRGSRPLLSFDPQFKEKPHYSLLKELLTQTFGVPNHHPKSQPFFDHVFTFTILDNRIWFRNFQILSEDGALAEVGPRFVLNPVKMFAGSFGGAAIWDNPLYTSPARIRQMIKKKASNKYVNKIEKRQFAEANKPENAYKLTPLNDLFEGDELEKAEEIEEKAGEEEEGDGDDDEVLKDDEDDEVKKPKPKKVKKKKKNVQNGVSVKSKVSGKNGSPLGLGKKLKKKKTIKAKMNGKNK